MREVERERCNTTSSSSAPRQGSPQRSGSSNLLRSAAVRSVSAWSKKLEIGGPHSFRRGDGSARAERVVSDGRSAARR